jgi:hypothetical protein
MMDWDDVDTPRERMSPGPASAGSRFTRRLVPPHRRGRSDIPTRSRSRQFGARLEATAESVGITRDDEDRIEASRSLIAARIDDVADEVYGHLRARPELVVQFADDRGSVDHDRLGAHRDDFREWLLCVINDPLDADTGEYIANVGHAHVRPRIQPENPLKARYLVDTIARVQALFIAILARSYSDPSELAKCASAWSRRLMVHLDLLLAVYSATQGNARWY